MAPRNPAGHRPHPGPLYQTIYEVLRRHILEDRLPSGLVIGPAGVARAFNSSRIPATAALKRLKGEGLLTDHNGRGYRVGDGAALRLDLEDAGLDIGAALNGQGQRNRHGAIYPEVERVVAACLAHGRFLLNESALAQHYRVSRTVAHEVLTRLERAGIVVQESNQRWYAGPLTPEGIRQHYEMRWVLEPVALRQSYPRLDLRELANSRARLMSIVDGHGQPAHLQRLEHDLHHDALALCGNGLLLSTIRRSQLPLLATHWTFQRSQSTGEIANLAHDHIGIFDELIAGRLERAASLLEAHLRRSVEPNVELLRRLGAPPPDLQPPYLVRAD